MIGDTYMFATLVSYMQEEAVVEPDFVLDVSFLAPLIGLFVPIVVGIVAKSTASSKVKAILNLTLSAVAAYITYLISVDGAFLVKDFFNQFVVTWVASLASYAGFWRPSGIAPAVQSATADVGVG